MAGRKTHVTMSLGRLIYCFVVGSMLLHATDAYAQHPDLKFEHFDTKAGLAHGNIFDVLQDSKGFIWVGTERGLSRFDGRHFKTYKNDPADSTSLYDHFITKLVEDHKGIIWLAAREALIRFDPETEAFTKYLIENDSETALKGYIEDLLVDMEGDVWVATDEGGLSKVDAETGALTHYRHVEGSAGGISSNEVLSLTQDSTGLIWAGLVGGGIDRFDPNTGNFEHLSPNDEGRNALPEADVNALFTDSTGTVWLGTDAGLHRYDGATATFERFEFSSSTGNPVIITDISAGTDESLWLGTYGQGIVRFDPNMHSRRIYKYRIGNTETIPNNQIRSVMQDRSGNLWTATNSNLSKANLERKPFFIFRHTPNVITSLSDNTILGITQGPLGDLWIATLNGLNRYEQMNGRFIRYFNDPLDEESIAGNEVWSVFTGSDGSLWLGAIGKGVDRMKPGEIGFTHYAHDPDEPTSFQGQSVYIFYEDSKGRLWMGSELGLHVFHPETETFSLFAPDTNTDAAVRAIQEDRDGLIWIGTEGHGLFSFDADRSVFTAYPYEKGAENGLASANVLVLFRDSDDVLWVGTDRGLNVLNRGENGKPLGTYDLYLEQDGLADNGIVGILEDDEGRLWISTSSGLSRATKTPKRGQSKDAFTLGFRNYDYHDGLPSNVFYIGPTYKDVDGVFYFGGDKGVTMFHPAEIEDNKGIPAVTISDIQLFNKSLEVGEADENGRILLDKSAPYVDNLSLSYKDRVVSISFAALHYGAPEKNQFKYRLEGFEDVWNDAGDIQEATYTNLPAGDYTFRVIASNLDGVWNEEGASIKISVAPPFWKTTWFTGGSVFLFVMLLVVGYQSRMRSIRRRHLQLEKKVANRTEQIRDKNLQLQDVNNELMSMNKALKESNYKLELKSQELKDALEKNKEILGITAHDLKNPLGGIIGLSEIILEDAERLVADKFVAESVTNVKMLKAETETMLLNVMDLLDRYREKHIKELKLERVNLWSLVRTVCRWNQKAAQDKQILIVYKEVGEIFAEVDGLAIQRVMDNLVSNAVKYNLQGHTIHIFLERKEHVIRFAVQDNGQGLTLGDKEKVFGKLQRLSATPTAGEHSSGLGLYIVKQLIEMHNGKVGVESEFGHGATFWFEVPAHVSSPSFSV